MGKFEHGFGTQLGAVLLWRRVPSDFSYSWTTYVSYLKKTSLFRTLPVRQTSYRFILVLAIVCIFKDNILIYICSNLHLCSIYLLFYLCIYLYLQGQSPGIYIYICITPRTKSWTTYVSYSKKNVPVQDTACSAD